MRAILTKRSERRHELTIERPGHTAGVTPRVTSLRGAGKYFATTLVAWPRIMSPRHAHTILVIGSSPDHEAQLSIAFEVKAIDRELQRSSLRDRFDLRQALGVAASELPGLVMRYEPEILHFCGHGNEDGELVFHGRDGASETATTQTIARVFDALPDRVRCVVLNCCHSEVQARDIAGHVDVVIGMRGRLPDVSGHSFAAGFYEALGFGRSFADAFELAILRVELEALGDDVRPVLYTRAGVDAARTWLSPTRTIASATGDDEIDDRRGLRVPIKGPVRAAAIVFAIVLLMSTRTPEPELEATASAATDATLEPCPVGFERAPAGYCQSVDPGHERVLVPAGPAYVGNDSPRRRVVLDAFAIGRTEVSVAQYRSCVAAGSCEAVDDHATSSFGIPSSFAVEAGDDLPANYIDWEDARAYCRWADGDLCTSEQWEKAAVGGCELHADEAACEAIWPRTPWGAGFSCEHAAFNDRPRHDPGCRSYHGDDDIPADRVPLWPVESHPRGASPYGAVNMIGNVWEWVADTVVWELDVGSCPDCKDTRGCGVLSSREDSSASYVNPAPRGQRWGQRGICCCWQLSELARSVGRRRPRS